MGRRFGIDPQALVAALLLLYSLIVGLALSAPAFGDYPKDPDTAPGRMANAGHRAL